jgi:hypothetical protein
MLSYHTAFAILLARLGKQHAQLEFPPTRVRSLFLLLQMRHLNEAVEVNGAIVAVFALQCLLSE